MKSQILIMVILNTRIRILRAGRVAQVVEDLPSKCEVLISNPSTNKKKKEEERKH
jgi:hypothetical protein